MRMRKKPNLIPRLQKCERVLVREPEGLAGSWRTLFPGAAGEIHVELGCGKGRFTAETAQNEPEVCLIAIEKVPDAMVIAAERVCALELTNVRFIIGDAVHLPELFAPGEVQRIYINFCDPWPTKRHEKRRLTSPGFLELYKKVLAPGGEIHFKTDNADLFEYSLPCFEQCGFALLDATRDLHAQGVCGVMTDYEAKFHAQGVPIKRCVARMK